jgi:hypothetical protein
MRYINLHKYNTEFAGKIKNPRIFYNPDNTVAIFDEQDSDVWGYIVQNGEKLKEASFFMNDENYESIVQFLKENPIEPETELRIKDSVDDLKQRQKIKGILDGLGKKPTAAKVALALTELLKALI